MSKEHTERPEGKVQNPADASADRRSLRLRLRADRVAWVGIWALSVFLIVVSVFTAISRPGPTQVTTSAQSLSYDLTPIPTQAVPGVLVEAEPQDPSQAVQYTLAYWADALGAWLPISLYPENSHDDEDETVPFMLRMENAVPDGTYTFNVRHDCAHRGGYDLLNSYGLGGNVTLVLYTDGPGTSIPDATLALPDGLTGGLDGTADGPTFKLWGGSFTSAAPQPSAVDICLPGQGPEVGKEYALAFTALSETVFLLWNGQLAPYMD